MLKVLIEMTNAAISVINVVQFSTCRKLAPTSNVNASCDNVTSTDDPVKKSSDGEGKRNDGEK